MNDDMRINFNERLEDNSEIKVTENALTENRKLSIPEDDYSDDLEQMLEKTEKKQRQYVYFSGKADVNSDYGKGGGNQYFIQNASFLKEKGNIILKQIYIHRISEIRMDLQFILITDH